MRINTNVAALNTHRVLSQTNLATARSIGRLSSGYRINRAADDAAGLAIANKFRADLRSLRAAQQNVTEATSMLQVAEGAVNSISDILGRMKELATQAASSNAGTQTATLNAEFTALKEEINRIVGSANYQGTALLDGTFDGTFQVGAQNLAADRITITLNNGTPPATVGLDTVGLGIDASTLAETAGSPIVPAMTNAQNALDAIDTAIGRVNSFLGTIGATQNRLDYAAANIATTIENYSASESAIRDADMAFEMTTFTRNQIMQQAATAMLAQANMAPQSILQLLG